MTQIDDLLIPYQADANTTNHLPAPVPAPGTAPVPTTGSVPYTLDYYVPRPVTEGVQAAAWASLLTLGVVSVVLWRVGLKLSQPVGRFFDRQSERFEELNSHLVTAGHNQADVQKTLARVEGKLEQVHNDLRNLRL